MVRGVHIVTKRLFFLHPRFEDSALINNKRRHILSVPYLYGDWRTFFVQVTVLAVSHRLSSEECNFVTPRSRFDPHISDCTKMGEGSVLKGVMANQ